MPIGTGELRKIHSRVVWMLRPVDRLITVSAPQRIAHTILSTSSSTDDVTAELPILLRLRPRVLTASAKTGRHVDRLLTEAITLADRSATRIPTPQLNRFLGEVVAARQPPVGAGGVGARSGHRLRLLFMTQTAERPPRFSIQVNSRARVTRDYAYFIENRLRERYGLDGVPVIIDFVARNERRPTARGAAA